MKLRLLSNALVLTAAVFYAFLSHLRAQTQDVIRPMFTPSTASTSSAQSGLASPKVVENRAAGLFKPDQAAQGKILQGYGKLPLTFEANQGQTDERVKFLSRGAGYNLFLTSGEAVLVLRKTPAQKKEFSTPKAPAPGANQSAVLHMQLLEANPASDVSGLDETPGKSNYFIGDDPKKWRTNVANYTKVRYKSVYPGVDLVYYGNQGQLEYDFVVAPGVDPNKIRLKFRGTGKLRVDEKRDLLLGPGGEVARLKRPVVYQEVAGQRKAVEGSYVLMSANRIGFQLGEYDHTQPLVIDPVLSYSTYLGGSGGDGGLGVAVDQLGNAYVTGGTSSTNFPTVNALQSTFGGASQYAFISKINASGSALVYSTYLGGSGYNPGFGGQGINFGSGIAVDAPGNAYVTGGTTSPNFPTANALQSTAGGG